MEHRIFVGSLFIIVTRQQKDLYQAEDENV